MLLFGIAHAHPPLLAGGIHAFCAVAFEDPACSFGLIFVISKYK
jgi:hypothetical protein